MSKTFEVNGNSPTFFLQSSRYRLLFATHVAIGTHSNAGPRPEKRTHSPPMSPEAKGVPTDNCDWALDENGKPAPTPAEAEAADGSKGSLPSIMVFVAADLFDTLETRVYYYIRVGFTR